MILDANFSEQEVELQADFGVVKVVSTGNGGGGFVASDNPPNDTSLLWIDTDDNSGGGGGADYPTDDHINELIDAKLGVIANASY